MRLLIKFESGIDQIYQKNYFHKFSGFVYNLLKESPFKELHDQKSYKFFCFSNLFPVSDIKKGEIRNFIISSPSKIFIKILSKKLNELDDVHIGDYSFRIKEFFLFQIKLRKNCKLISATPIIIRIPESKYNEYEIPEELRKRRYVYWRLGIDFSPFVKQLEANLFKKYNNFYKTKIKEFPIFEQFRFIKPSANILTIKGTDYSIVGSLWEFSFSHLTKEQKEILEFGIDCGFGERNTYGLGFVNIRKGFKMNFEKK